MVVSGCFGERDNYTNGAIFMANIWLAFCRARRHWHCVAFIANNGAVATRFKVAALVFMAASVGLSLLYGVPQTGLIVQIAILTGVSIFLVTRPAPPLEKDD